MKKTAIIAILAFHLSGAPGVPAAAQGPTPVPAGGTFELSVNPFDSEALRVYELERRVKREELEKQLRGYPAGGAGGDAGQETDIAEVDAEILLRLEELEDAVTEIQNNPPAPEEQGGWQDAPAAAPAPKKEEEFPRENPDAKYFGFLSFGDGPRAIFYNDDVMRTAGVGEPAPKARIMEKCFHDGFATKAKKIENCHRNGLVNAVREDRVIVGHIGVAYPREHPVLYAPPQPEELQ